MSTVSSRDVICSETSLYCTIGPAINCGNKETYNGNTPSSSVGSFTITRTNDSYQLVDGYERGVEDFTYACGTGTGSMVTVLEKKGLVSGKNVKVDVPGGRLIIDITKEGDKVKDLYLTGPTNIVCIGEVLDEELNLS